MIRADELEEQWSVIVSEIQLPEDWRKRIEELAGDGAERESILKEREETEEQLRRLTRLHQDLLIDDKEYRETLDRLQSHIVSLVVPENRKLIEAGNYLAQLGDLWAAASLEERRDLTRIMVKAVYVDVLNEEIVGIDLQSSFHVLIGGICDNLQISVSSWEARSKGGIMAEEKKELSVPEANTWDTAHTVAKGLLSFVPGAPELFEYLVVPPIEKRQAEWEVAVTERLLQLAEGGNLNLDKLQSDEQFTTIVLQATRAAIGTHQKEKRQALRNAVVNTALGTSIKEDLQLLFVRYLDELVPSHLALLRFFMAHETELAHADSYEVLYAAYEPENPEVSRDEFKMLCGDLSTRGLIRISRHFDDYSDLYNADVLITQSADDSLPKLKVTDIGSESLRYITHDM